MSSEPVLGEEESLEQIVRQLHTRVSELEAENEQLRDRVDDLEETNEFLKESLFDLEDTVTGEWGAITSRELLETESAIDELADLREHVEALKRGNVDELDLVSGIDPEYPIENDLAKLGNEHLENDLTANELRAAVIFRKFGGRAESWSGTMKLKSSQVKSILEEERGEGSLNNNTVKRAMKMLAKKTSTLPKGDRDAWDKENNLIWLYKGEKRLQLRADRDQYTEYLQEVSDRFE